MTNTLLELVDRLVATTNRATKAETEVEMLKRTIADLGDKLATAKEDYERCKDINAGLVETIKSKDNTITWGYNERVKVIKENEALRAELKEFKDKQAEDESYHTKIYPCDADTMGECPKRVQDCSNCKGETHDET